MTTANKIRANRANAQASSGPKTAQGRARASRNALRHGLSIPVTSDPSMSEEVEALAREIAGPDANNEIQELARALLKRKLTCAACVVRATISYLSPSAILRMGPNRH